jgi:hypothetical protein
LTESVNSAESELTAEAWARQKMEHGGQARTRNAQENEFIIANTPQSE